MKIYLKKSNNYTRDITFLNESELIEVNKTNNFIISILKSIFNNYYSSSFLIHKHRLLPINLVEEPETQHKILKETKKMLVYNHISSAFIFFYILHRKYLYNMKNIKYLNLTETFGLLEVLLYHKKTFDYKMYLFFGNLLPDKMKESINNERIELNSQYKDFKKNININDTYLDEHIDIDIIDNIIKNENLYNLVHIDTINFVKSINITSKYKNDFSHHYNIKKLYIGLNLLEDNGTMLFRLVGLEYNVFFKNIIYYLSNFFDLNYKRIMKDNTQYIVLYNFDRTKFMNSKNILRNIIIELNKICSNDKNFICDGKVIKKITKDTYDVNSIFKFEKGYDNNFNTFFDYAFNKINNISKINKLKTLIKKYCPTFDNCFNNSQLVDINRNLFMNNLNKTIILLEKYGLIVKTEFKQSDYESSMIDMMFNFNYNMIRSLNNNKLTISLKYINANKELIEKIKPLKKNYNKLNLLKLAIETRNLNEWSLITTQINIRSYIKKFIEKKYDIKVSRAYCKMYDILSAFNLINTSNASIKSFHACEAPGHFINATNDWIKKMNPTMEFDWTANSLNPFNSKNKKKYGNVFADDYGFISKYKERWDWGEDDTGDISNINNLLYYEKKYSVDLFTSDCGLSTESMEFEQECNLCFLSISQLVLGLLVLKVGGMMVCKIFIPFTKPLTLSIIYLYTLIFEKVHIIKQSSGSIGSSEVYIVGINKKHDLSKLDKMVLFDVIKKIDVDKILFDNIPDSFIKEMEETSEVFIQNQSDYIYRSFYYYDNKEIFQKHNMKLFYAAKNKYAEEWLKMNNYKLIPQNLRL